MNVTPKHSTPKQSRGNPPDVTAADKPPDAGEIVERPTIFLFDLSRNDTFEPLKRLLEQNISFRLRYQRAAAVECEAARAQLLAGLAQPGVDAVVLGCQAEAMDLATHLVRALAAQKVSVPLIVAFEACDPPKIVELLDAGASEFLLAPFDGPHVLPRLWRLLGPWEPEDPAARRLKKKLGLRDFVGEDPALLRELGKIEQSARCGLCTLLVGETGTGKELCARAIHYLSRRRLGPFVAVNCGAIPSELLENELFGHEPGAFTGASAPSAGFIGEASGGVLFLDEVDALPPLAQIKFLRFLQSGEYRPLGSQRTLTADVRVIAATNCDLGPAIQAGTFRRDFYYRLNAVTINLPPLRERAGDISLLAEHFLRKSARTLRKPALRLSPAALRALVGYPWPGNVRELENVIQQAVLRSKLLILLPDDLRLPTASPPESEGSFRQMKAAGAGRSEEGLLRSLLVASGGNVTQAAHAAGLQRSAFQVLLRKYHIQTHDPGQKRLSPSDPGAP